MSRRSILAQYGSKDITKFDLSSDGKALVSDDTQMTLFTACGMLNAKAENDPFLPSICEAYIEWLFTQMGKKKKGCLWVTAATSAPASSICCTL